MIFSSGQARDKHRKSTQKQCHPFSFLAGIVSAVLVKALVTPPRRAFVDDEFWEVADNFHKDL